MSEMLRRASMLLLVSLVTCALVQCNRIGDGSNGEHDPLWPKEVPDQVDFVRDVKPLLEVQCLQCHNSKDAHMYAGLNLETRKLAMTTGRQIPVIRPGDPANSPLIMFLKVDGAHPTSMPPAPDKIWGVRLEILEKWIEDGADWPEDVRLVPPQDWEE